MGLYRQKKSKIWWINISYNGKRVRKSTGTSDKKLAEMISAKVMTQIVEGKWFDQDESKTRTLNELKERYLRERSRRKAPQSYVRDEGCFEHFANFFGDRALADITPRSVSDYKNKRLQDVDPQTVVKELGVLRNAFNLAIKEWEWCRDNPVSKVSMPKIPGGRVRFLKQNEIAALISCADEWFKPILSIALYTGLRQGNLISLTWDKLDLFKRLIVLDDTDMKNDERLGVPLNETVFTLLKDLFKVRLLNSNLVFHHDGKPFNKMKLTRALKRACKKAKITNFRFHDLRHTFASMLVQSGVDLYTVQKLLGHKDGRMTQRYAHLTQEKLASAVSRLEEICHNFVIPGDKTKGVASATP